MISSDSPTLPAIVATECFAQLSKPNVDVVLGPCEDGGYYLIGMKTPQRALFTRITWSTDRVTRETVEAAAKAGLNVAFLPLWYDADTIEDLERMWADLERDKVKAPRTHALLASLLPSILFGAESASKC